MAGRSAHPRAAQAPGEPGLAVAESGSFRRFLCVALALQMAYSSLSVKNKNQILSSPSPRQNGVGEGVGERSAAESKGGKAQGRAWQGPGPGGMLGALTHSHTMCPSARSTGDFSVGILGADQTRHFRKIAPCAAEALCV